MFSFLHNFIPSPTLVSFGPIHIYWYGLFIVLAILTAMFITVKLAKKSNIDPDIIYDLAFWLVLGGILGARIYDVLLELPYYAIHPLNVFKIWQGGLAIHGAIIAGMIIIWRYSRKLKINFFHLAGLIVPGLALAQAIGRWGNYFNQELFGYPTKLPWGIYISPANRPAIFSKVEYFHPTFLYESIGCLLIFLFLLFLVKKINEKNLDKFFYISLSYLFLYSILRFSLEFIRIDSTPIFFGLRWPQWASLLIIIISIVWVLLKLKKRANNKE